MCVQCVITVYVGARWGGFIFILFGISMGFKMEHDRGIDKTISFYFLKTYENVPFEHKH